MPPAIRSLHRLYRKTRPDKSRQFPARREYQSSTAAEGIQGLMRDFVPSPLTLALSLRERGPHRSHCGRPPRARFPTRLKTILPPPGGGGGGEGKKPPRFAQRVGLGL